MYSRLPRADPEALRGELTRLLLATSSNVTGEYFVSFFVAVSGLEGARLARREDAPDSPGIGGWDNTGTGFR